MSTHSPTETVYTTQSFVAHLEGQLTIDKESPFHILDSSNAYWCLVERKDTLEQGYIPTEIIETPLERIARVNRELNVIDLQPTVQDETEFSKRSNRIQKKNVQFSSDAPIEIQASEYSESDDGSALPPPVPEKPHSLQKSGFFLKIKKPKWLSKYGLKSKQQAHASSSSLKLLRVHTRNIDEPVATFKTVVLDESMTVENLVNTCIQRFKLQDKNTLDYEISVLNDSGYMTLENHALVKNVIQNSQNAEYDAGGHAYFQVFLGKRFKNPSNSNLEPIIQSQRRLSGSLASLQNTQVSASRDVLTKEQKQNESIDLKQRKLTERLSLIQKTLTQFIDDHESSDVDENDMDFIDNNLDLELKDAPEVAQETTLFARSSSRPTFSSVVRLRTEQEIKQSMQFTYADAIQENKETMEILVLMEKNFDDLLRQAMRIYKLI